MVVIFIQMDWKGIFFRQKNLELSFKVGQKLSLGAKIADLYQIIKWIEKIVNPNILKSTLIKV